MVTLKVRPRISRIDEAGSELVEMALTLPLLLLVLLAIVDFGLMFQRYEVIHNSAREGVRLAASSGASDTIVRDRVVAYVQGSGIPTGAGNPSVVVTPTTVSAGAGTWQARQVDVSYTHDYVFFGPVAGWVGGSFNQVTLTAQATMRNQVGGSGLP